MSPLTLALGNLYLAVHESIVGYTTLHSSATIYSLVHPQKCIRSFLCRGVVVFTYGTQFSDDSPSIGLGLLNTDGLFLDEDIQAQQHFTEFFMSNQIAVNLYEVWIPKKFKCLHFSEYGCHNMKFSGIVLAAVGWTVQRHRRLQLGYFLPSALTSWCPVVEGTPTVLRGVRPAAGERAGAGPVKGGRVSMCPQGDAR